MQSAPSRSCRLTLSPGSTQLEGPDDAIHCVQEALTVASPRAQYTRAVKYGSWDGATRLLRRPSNRFPTGLAARVRQTLEDAGYAVELGWPPRPPAEALAPPTPIVFRPYQQEAITRALADFRLILQCPSGAGKTEIGIECARRLGQPVLWLVHTAALYEQTLTRLAVALPSVWLGRIGAGVFELGTITVGIVASLKNSVCAPYWARFGVLIVDECHHQGAATWMAVANSCTNAWARIGLSGTAINVRDPVRRLQMEGALGPIVTVTEAAPLMDAGYLARPHIAFLRSSVEGYPSYEAVRDAVLPDWRRDPRRLSRMGGRLYAEAYRAGVVENRARNALLLQRAHQHVRRGEKVLILCRLIVHAQALHRLYQRAAPAIPSWQLDGQQRKAVKPTLAAFREASQGAVLFATPFFREGVDLPELDVYVNAAAGQAEIGVLQALGRVLRPRPDKSDAAVYDFMDGGARTGRPDKDYLGLHAQERLRIYREQGFEVTTP